MAQTAYDADDEYGAHWIDVCAGVLSLSEEALTRQNALDFDDLLMRTAQLLETSSEVQAQYHDRYQHLMIDEFQDTNIAQYRLGPPAHRLAPEPLRRRDPDQSIYSWRNADIRNILSFQSDFPDAQVISLGENYRSTRNILNAASSVIATNKERIERPLYTSNPVGDRLTLHEAYSEEDEAAWAVDEVSRLSRSGQYCNGDCAIMYRINAQSRAFEDQCMRQGIPTAWSAGCGSTTQGNQDVMCYLRVIYTRRRGEPATHHQHARPRHWSEDRPGSNHLRGQQRDDHPSRNDQHRAGQAESGPCPISVTTRAARSIADLSVTLDRLGDAARELPVADLLDRVLDMSGLAKHIHAQDDGDERWENILELRGLAEDYGPPADGSVDGLSAFLERVSLVSDVDQYEQSEDALTLITLHQAKGLESPSS